jgi:hypothetical protein
VNDSRVGFADDSRVFEETVNFAGDSDSVNIVNDSSVLHDFGESFVSNHAGVFEESVTNISEVVHNNSSPVTVNFNAYNDVRVSDSRSGGDVDSVMAAFCDRLSEAVVLAADGL